MFNSEVYYNCMVPQISELTKPLMGFNLEPCKKYKRNTNLHN
jgi:hypothetical protein